MDKMEVRFYSIEDTSILLNFAEYNKTLIIMYNSLNYISKM